MPLVPVTSKAIVILRPVATQLASIEPVAPAAKRSSARASSSTATSRIAAEPGDAGRCGMTVFDLPAHRDDVAGDVAGDREDVAAEIGDRAVPARGIEPPGPGRDGSVM